MMHDIKKQRIEYGDFQTPERLAYEICNWLKNQDISPDIVVEPTCGVGAFVQAAAKIFPAASSLYCFDINRDYLNTLRERIADIPSREKIHLKQADFFDTNWPTLFAGHVGKMLVIGNFPWVTNSVQGIIGGGNLPQKSNFLKFNGFDAITGKANFDISEWMLLNVLSWFSARSGYIAMLVKTAVARKILSHALRIGVAVSRASLAKIDAKKEFGANVDACLLFVEIDSTAAQLNPDYTVFETLSHSTGRRVGHRAGLTVGDLDAFEKYSNLVGASPQKWRSGVKHDAASVMEMTRTEHGLQNGSGEKVEIEPTYLYPLLKGSDIGSNKPWRNKYILITQHTVGEPTNAIRLAAPLTWKYLENHALVLDKRGSSIYAKNPRFSIFGIGDYAFKPWRIAICGLYKVLRYRLVGPIDSKPVMFDDTVYYLSFDSEHEARKTLNALNSEPAIRLLSSLIFWDEKRPIKTGILNILDWSRLQNIETGEAA